MQQQQFQQFLQLFQQQSAVPQGGFNNVYNMSNPLQPNPQMYGMYPQPMHMFPAAMNAYLTNNNQGAMIIPFSGEFMDTSESIYDFLEQISYLPSFKSFKIEQNKEKIDLIGSYLRSTALSWFRKINWNDIKFGSDDEAGTFVYKFINQFLTNEVKYRLRMAFNRRIQGTNEEAASYIKDKVYLYKKFNKIVIEDESGLVADVVQNLNLTTQKNLRTAPTSLEDLKAQLAQADWIAREELRISLAPMINNGLNINTGYSINNSNNGFNFNIGYNNNNNGFNINTGYNINSGNNGFDINNINTAQLHSLKQQWDLFQLQQNMNMLQVNSVVNENKKPIKSNFDANYSGARAPNASNHNQNVSEMQQNGFNETLKIPKSYGNNANSGSFANRVCYNCSGEGHIQRNCLSACGNCGDVNHTASGCRKPRKTQGTNQDFPEGRRQ